MNLEARFNSGMLSRYRVLDLACECGLACGKILANPGADALQIRPPAMTSG
jgi:crotonobetainyl-CoA:carnitine CoA-transferase CaiB-like acyl-CoA transferase